MVRENPSTVRLCRTSPREQDDWGQSDANNQIPSGPYHEPMDRQQLLGRGEFFGVRVASRQLGGFSLALTRYERRMSIPWHAHEEPYLTFVLRGGYRERVGAATRDCRPRAVVLHPPGELHADEFGAAAICLNLHIDPHWLRKMSPRGAALERADVIDSFTSGGIGARVAREFRRADDLSPMVMEGLMLELFAEAARERGSDRAPAWLREVRSTIAARFTEPLTLASLADSVGIHVVHLARSFRRHYGCTVGELIRELRVDFARSRIRSGAPLRDVATEAGFADQSHLTRTFRAVSGSTPAEFRRAHRVPRR